MKKIFLLLLITMVSFSGFAQDPQTSEMTREQVLSMSVDELSQLPLEDLMAAMDLMGVSSMEELTNLLINKDVSSASKRVENAFDSPLSSTVLTKQEIEMSGATTIEEALRMVPGVIVREKTNGNFDIHIRGLDNLPPNNMLLYSENTNTLLMIDGRPMFNYAHGAIVWDALPIGIADIDRIEVVRGAASALYGPNAVNGVINILTLKTTEESPILSADVQAGTQDTYIGNVALQKQFNKKINASVTTNFQSRNRNRNEIYLYENSGKFGDFYSLEDYNKATVPGLLGERDLMPPEQSTDELFENPNLARENFGVNAYLHYAAGNNISFDVSAGIQDSYVNSSSVGDQPSSFSGRKSNTGYGNLMVRWGNFSAQTNYTTGVQNFAMGEEGFKIDMGQFNSSAEYNWQFKRLNIKPGVSYQSVFYDDMPYLKNEGAGYFNGKKDLNTFATSLRSEFLAFGKLRLIAALRAEKYNYPDAWQPSWQFAGTFSLANNQTIRVVYSRANRSSFIVNSQSDYMWDRSLRQMFPQRIHFGSNYDYDLMTTDMIELGYRVRPAKNILIETEFFVSENRDFGALLPYRSSIGFPEYVDTSNQLEVASFAQSLSQNEALPDALMEIRYQNIKLNARQVGGSFNIDWIISEKLIAKLHGTVQKTVLDNYSDWNSSQTGAAQLGQAQEEFTNLIGGILQGAVDLPLDENYREITASDVQNTDLKDDVTHKSTPSFWGLAGLVYRPTQKIEFTGTGYYLDEQTLINQNEVAEIDAKLILSAKASYKPSNKLEVFLNARNLLNNDSNEFAFMDNIGGIYLVGLRFSY